MGRTPVQVSDNRTLPPGFARSPRATRLREVLAEGDPVVAISGRAGTGKTTLMRYLMSLEDVPQVILAPTGMAAIEAGGQTIHSFFSLPPRILDPHALDRRRQKKIWGRVERIIIDEISMVRADLLDAIDTRLREARRSRLPFGGVQMVFVGDYLQLPPVVPEAENEVLARMGYENGFAFSAKVMQAVLPTQLRLETVHRQSDPYFVELLGALRAEDVERADVARLNEACVGPHRTGRIPLILTPSNAAADAYNARSLAALPGAAQVFTGKLSGEFDPAERRLPAPERLELKVGARVRALKNGPDLKWVNGSLGTVAGFTDSGVILKFDHLAQPAEIKADIWEKVRYDWDDKKERPISSIIGAYVQLPVALAWSSTIHKAQGTTLDDVRIDIGRGAFASGQAYVAVSRARSLDGLSLAAPLSVADFFVDPAVLDYERTVLRDAERI